MSYTKYTWETGEVITAAKLNHMEDGIANAPNNYTITNTNGKTVIAASAGELKCGDVCVLSTELGDDVETDAQIVLYTDSSNGTDYAITIYVNTDDLQGTPFKAMEWTYSAEDGGYIIPTDPNS